MYYEISFPDLGLTLNPARVAFSIGGKSFYWYGIIIAVGFLLAVFYALRRCDQFGLTQDNMIDMLICAVPSAIIFARVYYCLFEWEQYSTDPIRVLYIWEGGIAIYGAIIGSVLALVIFTKVKKLKTAAMLDIGGLGLLIGQSIGRWGNFINREAFGSSCDSFLRMGLTTASGSTIYVHPAFLYESLWNALGLLLLHFLSKRRRYDGQIFVTYLGWYGLGRVFIEGLRADSLYLMGTNLRISQLVAGMCVVFAVVFLFYNRVFKEHDPDELYVHVVESGKTEAAPVIEEETLVESNGETVSEEEAEEEVEEESLEDSVENPEESGEVSGEEMPGDETDTGEEITAEDDE